MHIFRRRMSRPGRELKHMGDNSEKTPPDAEWPPGNPPPGGWPHVWTSTPWRTKSLKVVRIRAFRVFNSRGQEQRMLAQADIVRTLLAARMRISASAWVIVRDAQAAEDIFQNVTVKALGGDARFEREAQLVSWAHVTARHEALNLVRSRKTRATVLDSAVLELLEADWVRDAASSEGDRVEALRQCLDALPKDARRVLHLRYFEERSCAEVSEALGVGLDAIYQRLSRLHRALARCIERRLAGQSPRINLEAS
ncbi:MAG: sigma-70 family RNA polymerase sigma factor [Planctomycetes bacterium]|nr:sigma-70 family RNA polymerase sigma factor [Planctomycetota bacterium]